MRGCEIYDLTVYDVRFIHVNHTAFRLVPNHPFPVPNHHGYTPQMMPLHL